jgi:hypothetical protein
MHAVFIVGFPPFRSPQSDEFVFSSLNTDWASPWDEEESLSEGASTGTSRDPPRRRRNPLRFLTTRLRRRV